MANAIANAHATADTIPDELLLDIFTRMSDPVDLLRCTATCTRWLRVLGNDRAILRRAGLLPEKEKATFVLGSFHQHVSLVYASEAREKKSECPPQFGRLHAPSRRLWAGFTSSFIPNDDGLFNFAKPLASHRGLLLTRLLPAPLDLGELHLAVCQPLTGDVHLLPPPVAGLAHDRLGRDVTGYALLTGPAPAFRVLFTAARSNSRLVYAYSYSSATGVWSAPMECPQAVGGLTMMSGPPAGVVDGSGTVHWLYRDHTSFYTLDVSADASRASLTKMPIPVPANSPWQPLRPPLLCIAGGGKLAFVNKIDYAGTLELWTKQDDDHGLVGWMSRKLTDEPWRVFGFAESRGALVVHGRDGLFCLDLESQELEHIRGREGIMDWYPGELCIRCACPEFDRCQWCMFNHRVLYDMDWSSYILHLLRGSLGGSSPRR